MLVRVDFDYLRVPTDDRLRLSRCPVRRRLGEHVMDSRRRSTLDYSDVSMHRISNRIVKLADRGVIGA